MAHTWLNRIAAGVLAVAIQAGVPGAEVVVVPSNEAADIAAGLNKAKPGDTVLVGDGTYSGNLRIPPGVTVAARNRLKAAIRGAGRGPVVTLSSNSAVSGFRIENGTIGVLSASANNRITECMIVRNLQSGIICIGHLPLIQDNIIAYNRGSGLQGCDVRSTSSTVNHNTISYNDNHGIALAGSSSVIIENNIIAYNSQFGLKIEPEEATATLTNNDIFQNATVSRLIPAGNTSVDPLFADPQRLDFSLQKESHCAGAGSDLRDLGSRCF